MRHFYEMLTNNGIKQITDYLKSAEGLYDEEISEYIKLLSRHAKKQGLKQDDIKTFFDKHGISELNWGRKNDAVKQFVNLFNENDNLDKLNEIIKNNGTVSIYELKESGNIFNDYCKGFEDEAKTIASWTNSTSANAGPCEMLLKFIIREGTTLTSGDVGIKVTTNEEEMEVKAGTLKGSSASGGHAAGQRGNIRKAWSIYWYLDHNLFGFNTSNSEADKLQYFQNEKDTGFYDFIKKLKENNLLDNPRKISDSIVEALEFQYNFISNEKDAKSNLSTENLLKDAAYDQFKQIISKDGISSFKMLTNIVGCIQLYLYSQVENFNYFFVVMLDKTIEKESSQNGFYFFVKDCKTEDSGLLDFNKILNYLTFGPLDSTTSTQGRTGKIKFVKK